MSNTMVRLMQGDERFAEILAEMEKKRAEEAAQQAAQQAAQRPIASGPNWLLYGGIAVALAVAYYLLKGK